jgi:hypothetical protein
MSHLTGIHSRDRSTRAAGAAAAPSWVVGLGVLAKVVLLVAMARVAVEPEWGNLEGKAPGTRALTYPLLALVVPVWHLTRRPGRPYPWSADLLVTLPAFSDILGNRLDLFDEVLWFDDVMHAVNTGTLSAAVVLLVGAAGAPLARRLEIAIASGMTLALVWELWEYAAFVTRSAEASNAYVDTLGDLTLGWGGCLAAAVLTGQRLRPEPHAVGPSTL